MGMEQSKGRQRGRGLWVGSSGGLRAKAGDVAVAGGVGYSGELILGWDIFAE